MSDPLKARLDQLVIEQAAPTVSQTEAERQTERVEAGRRYARLARLADNEDVLWFLAEFVKPIVDKEQARALKPATAMLTGSIHANRHEIADEILTLLDNETKAARALVESLAERRDGE